MKKISLIILMSSISIFAEGGQTPEQLAQVREMQEKNAQDAIARWGNIRNSVINQGQGAPIPGGSAQGVAQQPNPITDSVNAFQGQPQPNFPSPQGSVGETGPIPGSTDTPQTQSQSGSFPPQNGAGQMNVSQNPTQQGTTGLLQTAQPQVQDIQNPAQQSIQPTPQQIVTPQPLETQLPLQNSPITQNNQGTLALVRQSSTQNDLPPPPPLPESIANINGGSSTPPADLGAAQPVFSATTISPEPSSVQQVKGIVPQVTPEIPQNHSSKQDFGDRNPEKCFAVCGQFTNYYNATLLKTLCQDKGLFAERTRGEIADITGVTEPRKQCDLQSLLSSLTGTNLKYTSKKIFPGSLTPQEFNDTCNKECMGSGNTVFDPNDLVIAQLGRLYDMRKQPDAVLALVSQMPGGFSPPNQAPSSNMIMPQG